MAGLLVPSVRLAASARWRACRRAPAAISALTHAVPQPQNGSSTPSPGFEPGRSSVPGALLQSSAEPYGDLSHGQRSPDEFSEAVDVYLVLDLVRQRLHMTDVERFD